MWMLLLALKASGAVVATAVVGMVIVGPSTVRAMFGTTHVNGIYAVDVNATDGQYRTIRYDTSRQTTQAKLFRGGAPVKDVLMYMGVYPVTMGPLWYAKARKPMDFKAGAVASLFPVKVGNSASFNTIDFGGGMEGLKMACTSTKMTVTNRVTGVRDGQKWDIYQIDITRDIQFKEDSGPSSMDVTGPKLAAVAGRVEGKKDVGAGDVLAVAANANIMMFQAAGDLLKRTGEMKRRQREEDGYDACTLPEWVASDHPNTFSPETVTVWYDAVHDIPVGIRNSADSVLDFGAAGFLKAAAIRSSYKDEVRDIGRWSR
jgi:hypothetical protein